MNELELLQYHSHVNGLVDVLKSFTGRRLRIYRVHSKQGLSPWQLVSEGICEDVTLSFIVILRTDLYGGVNSEYRQRITYTFSDFLVGLYKFEVIDGD